MLVCDRMSRRVTAVPPHCSTGEASALLDAEQIHHLPVSAKGRLVGIVTDRDLRGAPAGANTVSDVMRDKPVTVPPHASVDEAARLMYHHGIGALPVVDHGQLVGILTRTDILSAFIDLSGVAEPSYRLILGLTEEKGAAAQIRRIVDRCHGEIKWLHVDTRKRPAQAHLRVSIRFIDNLAAALEGAGFEVTAIVAPSPHAERSESELRAKGGRG